MEIKRNELPGISPSMEKYERLIPGKPGIVQLATGGKSNSTELKERMWKEFEDIPYGSYPENCHEKIHSLKKKSSMSGYQAQHIIPVEMAEHKVIKKIGMDMNNPKNGIPLPEPGGNIHALSTHKGDHEVYNEAVQIALDEIQSKLGENATIKEYETEVYKLQQKLKEGLKSGLPLYKRKSDAMGHINIKNKKEVYDRGGGATVEMWLKYLGI